MINFGKWFNFNCLVLVGFFSLSSPKINACDAVTWTTCATSTCCGVAATAGFGGGYWCCGFTLNYLANVTFLPEFQMPYPWAWTIDKIRRKTNPFPDTLNDIERIIEESVVDRANEQVISAITSDDVENYVVPTKAYFGNRNSFIREHVIFYVHRLNLWLANNVTGANEQLYDSYIASINAIYAKYENQFADSERKEYFNRWLQHVAQESFDRLAGAAEEMAQDVQRVRFRWTPTGPVPPILVPVAAIENSHHDE